MECQVCGEASVEACGGCGAMFYCGRAHAAAHWAVHWEECSRMAGQVSRAEVRQ